MFKKKDTMKNFGILLLAMVSCCLLQAKDRVVKQPPFIARSSFYYRDRQSGGFGYGNRIGCKSLFSVLHNWIQISNESYLLADNGEKYRFVPVMELPWAKKILDAR